jgi:predicted permease
MFQVLLVMAGVIALGVLWRRIKIGSSPPDASRRVLTDFVYYIFLPALVLRVLWKAPLGWETAKIAVIAAACVLLALLAASTWYRRRGTQPDIAGALILAAAFPNVTYLGLPVLEATFGPWARSIAIEYDLFACTPLLLTVGVALARRLGEADGGARKTAALLRIPAVWAALAAVGLDLLGIDMPEWCRNGLDLLGAAVVPLMLVAVGLSLQWQPPRWELMAAFLPVVVIQLIAMPMVAWLLGHAIDLSPSLMAPVTLEAGMPSMVLGVVICDRFHLNTPYYAFAVTLTTLVCILTLPLWHAILSI